MVQQDKVKDDLRKMAASTETSGNHSNSRELETDGNEEDVSEETTSRLPEENELRSQQEYHTPGSSATGEVNDPNNERSSLPLIETQQDSAVANEAAASEVLVPKSITPKIVATARRDVASVAVVGTRLQRASQQTAKLQSSMFTLRTLEGHNDLICSLDCCGSVLVSGR